MQTVNLERAFLGGFAATVAITALIYAGPMMGMPEMDVAALIAWAMSGDMPEPMTRMWWVGMIEHFVNGTLLFPLVYATLVYPLLPGKPWLRGLAWGVTLWFLAQTVAMPLIFCMGFFTRLSPQPLLAVVGSLMGHLVYGVVFGAIAGPQAARLPRFGLRRPANV